MVVQHNVAAINAERMGKIVSGRLSKSSEKLSSGYKINRAADSAAGLAISEKMRFQIRGLDRGASNIEEGVGYCQVADGALNEIHDMLQRMNELSVQAANGTNSDVDRMCINAEIQALKKEVDRICITTKYNDEYIFKCDDEIIQGSHEVYTLKFWGYPEDLCIYNDSYDAASGTAAYGGVAYGGKRYAWAGINPDMYDSGTGKFRAGKYSFSADDGTLFTLVCADGSEPPQVSREFSAVADTDGIRVNGELVQWEDVRTASGVRFNKQRILNEAYYFEYRGVMISFTPGDAETFDDVMAKISGTVWNSTYKMPTEETALIADFSNTTVPIKNVDQIREYVDGNKAVPKYILHAGDGTNSTLDGIWIEETDGSGNPTGNIVAGSQRSWADLGITNWGDQSRDLWKDKLYHYIYDYCAEPSHDSEKFEFNFQVINEISKDSVIDALDGVSLNCNNIDTLNHPEAAFDTTAHPNVISAGFKYTGQLSLQDEYHMGRDYEIEQDLFQQAAQMELELDPAMTPIGIAVKYTNTIDGQQFDKSYGLNQTEFNSVVNSLRETIKRNTGLGSTGAAVNLLSIINERYKYGAANPTELTLAGVLTPGCITGGGAQTYFADTVRIDTSDSNLIYTKGQSLSTVPADYACGRMDFSGLGSSYQLADLIGLGFNSTCQTCSNHYSIQFTTQGLTPGAAWQDVVVDGNTYKFFREQSGVNYTLYIDVDSMQGNVQNGIDFSNTLVNLIEETKFQFHYTQYATKKDDAVLYAFDYRPGYAVGGVSTATNADFEPFAHGLKNTLDVNLNLKDLDASASGKKLGMNLSYQYNVSNLLAPDNLALTETQDDMNGKYVKDVDGKYVPYDANVHTGNPPRYNITVTGINTNNQDIDTYLTNYVKNTLLKDLADVTKISLKADHYATGRVQAKENANKAMVTQYEAPRQVMPKQKHYDNTEKTEFLTIQCSSNVIDNIEIEKQKLSVYRMGLYKFKTLTEDQATKGINMVRDALNMVSAVRSRFGAYQNRLEHAFDINRNTHENTQHAESVIRDTDMAEEMITHSNNSVLQQAGTSMLAQASQANTTVLALLRG